ncbi:MAG: phosphoribosylaminoimidazolesuccinocarboxamide synthase [bacterium]|nr:phosphoribosylaminoimidazolesuccinocarboxamide synthase [bacterium]
MEKRELLFEGRTKRLFATDRDNLAILEFKDDFLDYGGTRRARVPGKGSMNAAISGFLQQYLENYHVPTHFIEQLADGEILVRRLRMMPIEVVVYNVATPPMIERFGLDEGQPLDFPIVEYYLKDPKHGNPQINETHALALGYAKMDDIRAICRMASKSNAILKSLFDRRGLLLAQFSLEFGSAADHVCVGDEITPDTCRIWDKRKNRHLDRERFLQDLGGIEKGYRELHDRLTRAM